MALFHSSEPHELYSQEENTVLSVKVPPALLGAEESACTRGSLIPGGCLTKCDETMLQALKQQLLLAALAHSTEKSSELYLEHIKRAFELILSSQRCQRQEETQKKRRRACLERLLSYVEQNYMHKISLTEFARQEGLSMGYLSHMVTDLLGRSFQQHVGDIRFYHASRLIALTQRRLLEISMDCGYSDYRYFHWAFVERTGLPPEIWRQQAKLEAAADVRAYNLTREEILKLLQQQNMEHN